MNTNIQNMQFPPLPIEEWEDSKNTLHLFMQIAGKIRLGFFPKMNHWWHVPFYVSTRGITTGPIPYKNTIFEMEFDFREHVLRLGKSSPVHLFWHHADLAVTRFSGRPAP